MEQKNVNVKDETLSVLRYALIIIAIVAVIMIICCVKRNTARNNARTSVKYQTVELNMH